MKEITGLECRNANISSLALLARIDLLHVGVLPVVCEGFGTYNYKCENISKLAHSARLHMYFLDVHVYSWLLVSRLEHLKISKRK